MGLTGLTVPTTYRNMVMAEWSIWATTGVGGNIATPGTDLLVYIITHVTTKYGTSDKGR